MNALTPIAWHQSVPEYLRDASAMSAADSLGAAFESRAFARVSLNANRFTLISADGTAMPVMQADPATGFPFLDLTFIAWADKITKTWYATGYTDGNDAPPDCFSMDGVRPDPSSPQPQALGCAACPMNAFGSAANGNGKACGDKQRAAIVLAADTPVSLNGAAATLKAGESVFGFSLPPMTGKNLRAKVKQCKAAGVNLMGITLRAKFVSTGVVDFDFGPYISQEMWNRTRLLAASEETQRACGLLDVPAAVPALAAPPAHAQLAAPAVAPTAAVPSAAVQAVQLAPVPAPAPAPVAAAPFAASAPAFPQAQPTAAPAAAPATTGRKKGAPRKNPEQAAPPVSQIAVPPQPAFAPQVAPAAPQPAFAPAAAPAGFPGVAAAPPAAAPASVIQQPAASNADLDALLAQHLA